MFSDGHYLETCSNIKVTLSCNAPDLNAQTQSASFDITALSSDTTFSNQNGALVPDPTPGSASGSVPGGSYTQTCTNITVVLSCQAQQSGGSYQPRHARPYDPPVGGCGQPERGAGKPGVTSNIEAWRTMCTIARHDDILLAGDLPKTHPGKIMRRLLEDVAEGYALGGTTTLPHPDVVARLKVSTGRGKDSWPLRRSRTWRR